MSDKELEQLTYLSEQFGMNRCTMLKNMILKTYERVKKSKEID